MAQQVQVHVTVLPFACKFFRMINSFHTGTYTVHHLHPIMELHPTSSTYSAFSFEIVYVLRIQKPTLPLCAHVLAKHLLYPR